MSSFFTIELVIGVFEDVIYKRVPDTENSFDELEMVSVPGAKGEVT